MKATTIDDKARMIFTPWLAGVLIFFTLAAGHQLPVGSRAEGTFLASLIPAISFGAVAARRFNSGERRLIAGLFAASVLLQALPEIVHPTADSSYAFAWRASLVVFGWTYAFSLFLIPPGTAPRLPELHSRKRLAALIIVSFIWLSALHWAVRGHYAIINDEVLYLLQSQMVVTPGFTRHLDPWMSPFFAMSATYIRNGGINAQYTPGWPILLAAFHRVGLRWFAPVCMGVVAVIFTYLLGERLHSPRVGLVAGILLATNFLFVFLSVTYMSHAASIALCVMAAWLLIKAEESGSRDRFLLWILAGLTFGMVVMIRPLTGVAVSFSLWLWILVRGRMAKRDYVRMTIALALAAAVPLGFLLYYNRVTTGSAFSSGYRLAQAGLNGVRGYIVYGEAGSSKVISQNFTFQLAVFHFLAMVRDASLEFFPAFFFAPLVGLCVFYKLRFSWRKALVFLVLPLAYSFYWGRGIRFYSELLPFAMVGMALILVELAEKNREVVRWAIVFLITANLLFTAKGLWNEHGWYASFKPYFSGVEDLQRQKGKLLVFVDDKTPISDSPVLFDTLVWFDVDGFPGDVILARDLGADDVKLIAKWPDHFPVRLVIDGIGRGLGQRPTFVPFPSE
jgi:hypothetical protein